MSNTRARVLRWSIGLAAATMQVAAVCLGFYGLFIEEIPEVGAGLFVLGIVCQITAIVLSLGIVFGPYLVRATASLVTRARDSFGRYDEMMNERHRR